MFRDLGPWSSLARIVPIHPKAGFLLIGSQVFAYRYSSSNKQLTIANSDGAALFPPLTLQDASDALAQIQSLPHA